MNDFEFRSFLDLMMCSDPWPTREAEDNERLVAFANAESRKRGFAEWIDAFHRFKPESTLDRVWAVLERCGVDMGMPANREMAEKLVALGALR